MYDPLSGNGTELLRFSELLPLLLLALGQWIGGGSIGFSYAGFLGLLYFVTAAGIYWIGEKEDRPLPGFLAGLAWFFMPVNLHLLLAEGELSAGLVIALVPIFLWNLYCYMEKGKKSAVIGAMTLFFLMIMSNVEYAFVILIASVVYLILDGIVNGRMKKACSLLPVFPISYCLNGFWLCAFWTRYGKIQPTNV